MRKFLKTSHVISRIFLYLSVIGVLLLYFFKPGVMNLLQHMISATGASASRPRASLNSTRACGM